MADKAKDEAQMRNALYAAQRRNRVSIDQARANVEEQMRQRGVKTWLRRPGFEREAAPPPEEARAEKFFTLPERQTQSGQVSGWDRDYALAGVDLATIGPPQTSDNAWGMPALPHEAGSSGYQQARGSSNENSTASGAAKQRLAADRDHYTAGQPTANILTTQYWQHRKIQQFGQWLNGSREVCGGMEDAVTTLRPESGRTTYNPHSEFFLVKTPEPEMSHRDGQVIYTHKIIIEFFTRFPNGTIPTVPPGHRAFRHGATVYAPIFHISIFYVTDRHNNPVYHLNNNLHITSDVTGTAPPARYYLGDVLYDRRLPSGLTEATKNRQLALHGNDIIRQVVEELAYYIEYGVTMSRGVPLPPDSGPLKVINSITGDGSPLGRLFFQEERRKGASTFNGYTLANAQIQGKFALVKSLRAFAKMWMIFCANSELAGGIARDELHDFPWQQMKEKYERAALDVGLNRGRQRGVDGVWRDFLAPAAGAAGAAASAPAVPFWHSPAPAAAGPSRPEAPGALRGLLDGIPEWGGGSLSKKINTYIKKIESVKEKLKLLNKNKNKNKNKIILKNKVINDLKEKIKNTKEKLKKEKLKKEKLKKEKLKKEKLKKEKLKKEKSKKKKSKK